MNYPTKIHRDFIQRAQSKLNFVPFYSIIVTLSDSEESYS